MTPSPRPTYEELLDKVKELDAAQQLRFLEELAATVRRRVEAPDGHSILASEGLGKEVWQGVDAQEYVNRERAAWTG